MKDSTKNLTCQFSLKTYQTITKYYGNFKKPSKKRDASFSLFFIML